jgi:hypothetical protein
VLGGMSGNVLAPTVLYLDPELLANLKSQVTAELRKIQQGLAPPLEQNGVLVVWFGLPMPGGEEVVQIAWSPQHGFELVDGWIPLHPMPTTGQSQQGVSDLVEYLQVQSCLRTAPRSATSLSFARSSGDIVTVGRSCTVTIRTLTGHEFQLSVASSNTIADLKARIQEVLGKNAAQQQLFFAGMPLEDGRTLASYDIVDKSTLNLVLHIRAGPAMAEDREDLPLSQSHSTPQHPTCPEVPPNPPAFAYNTIALLFRFQSGVLHSVDANSATPIKNAAVEACGMEHVSPEGLSLHRADGSRIEPLCSVNFLELTPGTVIDVTVDAYVGFEHEMVDTSHPTADSGSRQPYFRQNNLASFIATTDIVEARHHLKRPLPQQLPLAPTAPTADNAAMQAAPEEAPLVELSQSGQPPAPDDSKGTLHGDGKRQREEEEEEEEELGEDEGEEEEEDDDVKDLLDTLEEEGEEEDEAMEEEDDDNDLDDDEPDSKLNMLKGLIQEFDSTRDDMEDFIERLVEFASDAERLTLLNEYANGGYMSSDQTCEITAEALLSAIDQVRGANPGNDGDRTLPVHGTTTADAQAKGVGTS